MADLRARGIIKTLTGPEKEAEDKRLAELRRVADEAGAPWGLILGIIAAVLAVMVGLGGGIAWLIVRYSDVSCGSTRLSSIIDANVLHISEKAVRSHVIFGAYDASPKESLRLMRIRVINYSQSGYDAYRYDQLMM